MALKTCALCGVIKDLEEDYYVSKDRLDGRQAQCKACHNSHRGTDGDPEAAAELRDRPIDARFTKPVPPVTRTIIPNGLLKGIPVPEDLASPCHGMWKFETPKGWRVLVVHYTADPAKRPGGPAGDGWIAAAKKAQGSERDWQREMELDYTVSSDQPFFPNFNRSVHLRPILFDEKLPLLRGWDFGQGHPAIVFFQVVAHQQVRIYRSFVETNKKIWTFADQVISETNMLFPGARKITDYGDPAGNQQTDKGATTQILLERFGIHLNFKFSFREEGLGIMEQKLRVMENGAPGLLIHPEGNNDLIGAFEGGYVLDTGASGKDKEGVLKNHPKKDGWYEHVMDALRYGLLNVFSMIEEERDDEAAWDKLSLWRTNKQNVEKKMKDVYDEMLL